MKRRFVRAAAFWLALVLMVGCVTGAGAHKGEEHNRELEKVFFGKNGKPKLTEQEQTRLTSIEYAAYLAIDQFNSDGMKELKHLRKQGIPNIPVSIEEFNFKGNHTHQRYTHMGWDESYQVIDKAKWKTMRKPLLLSTINDSFSFRSWNEIFILIANKDIYAEEKMCYSKNG